MFRRKRPEPDLEGFRQALVRSVDLDRYGPHQQAQDFRRVFLRDDDGGAGLRVLYSLLAWCGEFDIGDEGEVPPLDPNILQRWAGKHEIAQRIKAATYASLDEPS